MRADDSTARYHQIKGNCTTKRGQVEAPLVKLSVINGLTKNKDDSPMTDILTVHVIEAFMAGFTPKGVEPSAHTNRNYGLVLKASCCFVQCLVNIFTKYKKPRNIQGNSENHNKLLKKTNCF